MKEQWKGPFPQCFEHGLLNPKDFPRINFKKRKACPACGRTLTYHDRRAPSPLVDALERIAWHELTWKEARDIARDALEGSQG